jgi:ribosomal protein L11 methyltransferase
MGDAASDLALRVIIPEAFAEVAGALLMEKWGPFELEPAAETTTVVPASAEAAPVAPASTETAPAAPAFPEVVLVYYPPAGTAPSLEDVLAALPSELREPGLVRLETRDVSRDWVEGWKAHFRPITVGDVRIRPPWEPALGFRRSDGSPVATAPATATAAGAGAPVAPVAHPPVDVVINPGLGFGTGLHPTTRGTLSLLQHEQVAGGPRVSLLGPLVDAGTGSGILAIAAAKLGWGPIFAFDNDPEALKSARENIAVNGVSAVVSLHRADVGEASPFWFAGATVLANMTLEPVLLLVRRLAREARSLKGMVASEWPARLVVSGILAGAQEAELVAAAGESGFVPGERVYETEWVSLELFPIEPGGPPISATGAPGGGVPAAGASPSGSR